MNRSLDVYLYQHFVGNLIQDENGDMVFDYDPAWVENPIAIPLSRSLPLKIERYSRKECRGFFGGVLPESDNREIIARNLGISSKNDFAMLEQIGGECAGAVTFVHPGENFPNPKDHYHPLSSQELANTLKMLPRRPLLAGEEGVRLSLAGAQDKIAVYMDNGQISIPLDGSVSTHILKPTIEGFEGVVANEWFCMNLARQVGIPTAHTQIGRIESIDYLLVERYDRIRTDRNTLKRLHQEDFCQALGIVSENKYQNEGGPSLQQCFHLLRESSAVPAIDLKNLFNCVAFNFIIGNNDAHGKNFSLLYEGETGAETRLAPFYDVLSNVIYPDLSNKMAMKIGSEYSSERVGSSHFEQFSKDAGLNRSMVKRGVRELAEQIQSKMTEITIDFPGFDQLLDRMHRRIESIFNWVR